MAKTSTTENLTTEALETKLFNNVMQKRWKKVAEIYDENPSSHTITITSSGETALHLAISDPEYNNKVKNVEELVKHIENPLKVLTLKTEKGNTPLHSAAEICQGGKLCQLLIHSVGGEKNKNALELVCVRDKNGETPLFKAVHYGRQGSFFYLNSIIREHYGENLNDGQSILDDPIIRSILVREDGQSILHEAIIREHFCLAFYIIQLYKGLVNLVDNQGGSPLHALAGKPDAFESGSSLHGWDKLIYICIHVEKLKSIESRAKSDEEKNTTDNGVGKECTNIDIKSGEGSNIPPEIKKRLEQSPETSRIWYCFVIFGYGRKAFGNIYKEKLKHTWAKQVLVKLLDSAIMYGKNTTAQTSSSSGTNAEKDTALLIAANYGIVEMVKKIIKKFPSAIYDEDKNGNNVLLVAVKKRHLQLYKHLILKYTKSSVVLQKKNINGNNALHLAATYKKEQPRPWSVPGAALQMQWESKWYEFVKYSMPSHLSLETNTRNQTPSDIFTNAHKSLVKDGVKWLQDMAAYSSVVAVLIVTIAFAGCTTVPGGTDSKTGKPTLRNNSTFNIFAIASVIALYFSVTTLITFLVIVTSRHHEKDFGNNLPVKIFIGFISLFVSIAAMLVTFCAIHFLLFEKTIKYAAFSIYAVTSLPLCFVAIARFPYYVYLVQAIFFSPFCNDFSPFLRKVMKKVKAREART